MGHGAVFPLPNSDETLKVNRVYHRVTSPTVIQLGQNLEFRNWLGLLTNFKSGASMWLCGCWGNARFTCPSVALCHSLSLGSAENLNHLWCPNCLFECMTFCIQLHKLYIDKEPSFASFFYPFIELIMYKFPLLPRNGKFKVSGATVNCSPTKSDATQRRRT